jgi:hypothetical protein
MRKGQGIEPPLRLGGYAEEEKGHLVSHMTISFARHDDTSAGHTGLLDRGLDGKIDFGPGRNGLRGLELDAVLAYRDGLSGKTDG